MDTGHQKYLLSTAVGGASSGSKAGKQRQAVEADDTVQSKAMLSLVDLLGEGQIGGLVNGAQSIYFDNTPLMNPDGSSNFEGVTWEQRTGTQDQSYIAGMPDVETPYNVSVQIKAFTPYTFTIDNAQVDSVRVIIAFPSLTQTDKKTGDIGATTVEYKMSVSVNSGPFMDLPVVTINQKSAGKWQKQHIIQLPSGNTRQIRITRLTPDSTTSYTTNDTYLDSYYEIVDQKLRYPNSALVGVRVDSSLFDSVPDRAYLVDGLYIRVPSNYNADSNTYIGIWDGTFKLAVSGNPAWILYDILTHKRYGLGNFINTTQINKASLYTIGRYCDEIVPDGFGGTEKRFEINTCIQTQADAYKVVTDIAGVFRGMIYWQAGQVQIMQDAPADPQALFTNANVVDGLFERAGSQRKDQHSVVHVQWNDPTDRYQQKLEYVDDPDLINSPMGYRKTDLVAFGCTSRGQAHRAGLWMLYTEKSESGTISFTTAMDGLLIQPGDIIKIQDQFKAGERNAGRLKGSTAKSVVLDAPVQISTAATLSVMMPDGTFVDRPILEKGGTFTTLTFAEALPKTPVANAIFMVTKPDLQPEICRVMAISQGESTKPGQVNVICVLHNPSKFASIEQGVQLTIPNTTVLDPSYSVPTGLTILETTYLQAPGVLGSKLHLTWQGKSARYRVAAWKTGPQGGKVLVLDTETTNPNYEIAPVESNYIYDVTVWGYSAGGLMTESISATHTVLGTANPPSPPTDLTAVGTTLSVTLNWKNADIVDFDYVEIYEATVDDITQATYLARTSGSNFVRTGLTGLMRYYYWVRTVNKRAMKSDWNSTAGTSAIAGVIGETDLDKDLMDKINTTDMEAIGEKIDEAVREVVGNIDENLDEALAKAETARALVNIAEMMQEDTNVEIKRSVTSLEVKVGTDIAAQIKEVQEVAASDRQAVARQFESVNAQFQGVNTAIETERVARSTADEGLSSKIDTVSASIDDKVAAGVKTETDARVAADAAQASQFNSVLAQMKTDIGTDYTAAITAEAKARSDADSAQASTFNATIAQTKTDLGNQITAAVSTETTARTDADGAMSARIDGLKSDTDSFKASITSQLKTLTDADSATASQITQLKAADADNAALVQAEQKARVDGDSALAISVTNLTTKTNDMTASFNSQIKTLTDADSALSSKIDSVVAQAGSFDAAQTWQFDGLNDAQGWLPVGANYGVSDGRMALSSTGTDPYIYVRSLSINGALYPLVRVRVTRRGGSGWDGTVYYQTAGHDFDGAKGYKRIANPNLAVGQTTTLEFDMKSLDVGGTDWTSNTITGLRIDLGSTAQDNFDIDWISVGRIAPNMGYAAVQQTMNALQDTNGKLSAMYSIKVNVNSNGVLYTAGMGIGIETNGQGIAQSQIAMIADRFQLLTSVNGSLVSPFYVQDGNVYIQSAFINKATIVNAIVGSTIVSAAKAANGNPRMYLDFNAGTFTTESAVANGSYTQIKEDGIIVVIDGRLRVRMGRW